MMARATRCLDGLEEMLMALLQDAQNLARSLSENFGIHSPLSSQATQLH
jgi:hypothetical protein